jgi:nitroreductase
MPDNILEMIMNRRSVRAFTGGAVTQEQIETLLKAAMSAPSANNRQPWRFIVVTDRMKIKEICLAHPYARFGVDAGVVLVLFGEREGNYHFFSDMGAATENLLLAVANTGLGATWCGMNEERQALIKPLVGLPDNLWCYAVIPVGVPSRPVEPRTQYDPKKVWREKYS